VAGPIWNKFMVEALKILPDEKFEAPDLETNKLTVKPALRGHWQGNENFFIDKISKKLATAFTPPETLEEKIITNVHSILYWIDRSDVTGASPANPSSNPQFNHWEIPVQNWWAQNQSKYPVTTMAEKPVMNDDVHTEASKPIVLITEPSESIVYQPEQKIYLRITGSGPYPFLKMDVFINNAYMGTSDTTSPFSFTPSSLENIQPNNELKIIYYDTVYNKTEAVSNFRVEM